MVYVLHKFKHYLLENKFVFYMDHMVLLYLVKKFQLLGQIARWLLLFLEYNFSIVYKLRCSHFVVDSLSWLPNATKNPRILDQTTNASLFVLQLKWLQKVHTYISTRKFLEGYSIKQRKKLVLKASPFTIING